MSYGDLHLFDILIFGGIAAFLFYRLRGVLGKKTGFERKHTHQKHLEPTNNNVKKSILDIPELEPNIKELKTAYENLKDFNHVSFLEGAKSAFETIVKLFNQGDKEKLKPLLTDGTYAVFCKTIDAKEKQTNTDILSLKIESVKKAWIDENKVLVTIEYLSTQINTNDDKKITKKDVWTFEKNIKSKDPIWLLSST